jgi:hypothetical protein
MTIAAAYLVSDGVVFGADSTTTVSDSNGSVVQLLNHAQKVFEIGEPGKGRYGIATWGAGVVGHLSHRTLVARSSQRISETNSASEACQVFQELVQPEVDSALNETEVLGYFFGGIDPASRDPACWSLTFRKNKPVECTSLSIGEARFAGAHQFFYRLFKGFDPNLPNALLHEIKQVLLDVPSGFDDQFFEAFAKASKGLANVGTANLPVREAVDYVHTFLYSTIKSFKFQAGAPVCGGPIEIGFITTDRPFRWISHKDFSTAIGEHIGVS